MTQSGSIDAIIKRHKDVLADADVSLVRELERQLRPSCRLSSVECIATVAKRWAWRLLLLYLFYAGAHACFHHTFESSIDQWSKSDMATNVELTWQFFLRKFAVLFGLPYSAALQRSATGECLIGNPLHRPSPVCCKCKFNITASRVTNLEKVRTNFDEILASGKTRLFLIVNSNQPEVSYQKLRSAYSDNKADVESGFNDVSSPFGPSVGGLAGLFSRDDEPPVDSAVTWDFGHVDAVRHMRRHLLRPAIVASHIEINLQRSLLFIGSRVPNDKQVPLGTLSNLAGQVFAVGLHGETIVTVKSNPDCCTKPANRVAKTVTLKPGRLLSLPSECFVVTARRNGTGYSSVYFGSVPTASQPGQQQQEEGGGQRKRK